MIGFKFKNATTWSMCVYVVNAIANAKERNQVGYISSMQP
jgi:hypothetical protein